MATGDEKNINGAIEIEEPVSPHYGQLRWHIDEWNSDDEDAIVAETDDWSYHVWAVRGDDETVIGYRVDGGDNESGDEFGSLVIEGQAAEAALDEAKTAAQANYAFRYREAEGFLDELLDDFVDDSGPRTHRNEQGRIICRVDDLSVDEVEVVATLRDYFDDYDPPARRVTVCLRTVLSCGGDRSLLLEVVTDLVREAV